MRSAPLPEHLEEYQPRTILRELKNSVADATGKDERTIRRAAARGEALGEDLQAIAGTSLDKGAELDALASMKPEDRRPLIERKSP